jgi:hypothetical protein
MPLVRRHPAQELAQIFVGIHAGIEEALAIVMVGKGKLCHRGLR